MKLKLIAMAVALAAFVPSAPAQFDPKGPLTDNGVTKSAEVFIPAESFVATLSGAATNQVTVGKGILTGVEICPVSTDGGVTTSPFAVQVYDVATPSSVNTPNGTALSKRICADIVAGNTASTQNGTVPRVVFDQPVRFKQGVCIVTKAGATNGTVAVFWKK